MNFIEKTVYDLVKRNPAIKFFIRDLYQFLWDIIPTKRKVSKLPIITREGYYFGFHDKTPFSADDSKLLAGKYTIPLRSPQNGEELIVGYFDGDELTKYNEVARTKAWNWHQGTHLQWLGKSHELVFNDCLNDKLVARIIDTQTGHERVTDYPIATVTSDGKWGIGYNFFRVQQFMPGYGYLSSQKKEYDAIPDDDGLYKVDMETGVSKLILSINDICQIDPDVSMDGGKHYFSHAIIAPGGKRVMFLHRWIKKDYRLRWSRMFTCDLDGRNIYKFPTHEMVSHMGWKNENQILAYCRLEDNKDGYVLFDDLGAGKYTRVGDGILTSDGHPSYDKSGSWIITDTYPNRRRHQRLILVDTIKDHYQDLAKLYHPKKYTKEDLVGPLRCDLHPRWNRSGTMVCFDSAYTGQRSLCTMEIKTLIEKQ